MKAPKQQPTQRQETPQERLVKLQARLSSLELFKQLSEHQGYAALENLMRGEVNRRKKSMLSINWKSTPEQFKAFEKRSLYGAGFIQGLEFAINVMQAQPQQYAATKTEIESISKKIKGGK